MRDYLSGVAKLLLLAVACGPPEKDVEAARAVMRDLESNKVLIRQNHSQCFTAVTRAKTAQDSEGLARDFPPCVRWREMESRETELKRTLDDLCARTRDACERAEKLERGARQR
jgi:hypothetical protein